MAKFYVAYDLDKPGQDYTNLWDELESLGAQRVQDSVWVLVSNSRLEAQRPISPKYFHLFILFSRV